MTNIVITSEDTAEEIEAKFAQAGSLLQAIKDSWKRVFGPKYYGEGPVILGPCRCQRCGWFVWWGRRRARDTYADARWLDSDGTRHKC